MFSHKISVGLLGSTDAQNNIGPSGESTTDLFIFCNGIFMCTT